jgi:hypothetical protein
MISVYRIENNPALVFVWFSNDGAKGFSVCPAQNATRCMQKAVGMYNLGANSDLIGGFRCTSVLALKADLHASSAHVAEVPEGDIDRSI